MPQPPAKQFSGIFVSYRRDDSSGHAGRLSDRLVEHFGKERIFMDIDTIEPGEDFVTVIENAVGSCGILIAIIGRNWLTGTGGTTGRLDNPNDFVRLEIATALRRDIRVIPVLVQRASMPKPQDLPDDLAKFTRRNAVELSDLRWQSDVDQLISVMERVLVKREEAARLAEAASETEEEGQSREEQEKQRGAEERVRLEEEEAKTRAAKERRREEEEIERRAAEERASLEAHQESSRRRAEEERIRADAEARRRELSLAQRQPDQPSTASTTGAVSPAFKNKRVVLIAVASLVVLLVVAAVIWLPRGPKDSGNANQAAVAQPSAVTQPSTTKPSQTPATTPATPTPTPTPIDVTGTWAMSAEEFPLRLTQKGEIIVINQKMGAGYVDNARAYWFRVDDGRIIGDKITFCLAQSETVCYKGTVTGDEMKGTDDVNNPLHGGGGKARAQGWSAKRISKMGTQPNAVDGREKKRPL
jgi:hypothetical protein